MNELFLVEMLHCDELEYLTGNTTILALLFLSEMYQNEEIWILTNWNSTSIAKGWIRASSSQSDWVRSMGEWLGALIG